MKIKLKYSESRKATLKNIGVHIDRLCLVDTFNLEDALKRFTAESERLKVKTIDKELQLDMIDAIDLSEPHSWCISGAHTDLKAKSIVCHKLNQMLDAGLAPRKVIWHNVNNAYKDKIRDADIPYELDLLIISNVMSDSPQVKLEKVRDLLEMYSDKAVWIISSGCDPLGFCNDILKVEIDYVSYVKVERETAI